MTSLSIAKELNITVDTLFCIDVKLNYSYDDLRRLRALLPYLKLKKCLGCDVRMIGKRNRKYCSGSCRSLMAYRRKGKERGNEYNSFVSRGSQLL